MAKKTSNTPEDLIAQFQKAIDSSIPAEYKQVLQDFKKQGSFYTQLLQNIKTDGEPLESFWSLPETLGFTQPSTHSGDVFNSLFDVNHYTQNSTTKLTEQFSEKLGDFTQKSQLNFSNFQQALSKMSALHNDLNQRASERFNDLREKAEDNSDDSLCKLWLQAGEESFKETSQQKDYIDTQRTLFESLGELKGAQKTFTDQYSHLLGLPQQKAIDELKSGLHALRLEFAEYREQTAVLIEKITPAKTAPKKTVKRAAKKPSKKASKG
ncbi:MAG: hypothetical protein A6F71_08995 [Cycloclasticus sp. symbiont of Poecilosclerida sp. M]|nr:MAG: hypothetical protein A6F71_08995 [Cycloclasticus sp. symbiont of Poecilosclerida sp. M]